MKHSVAFLILFFTCFLAEAQEDEGSLLDMLGEDETINYASASFKTTRIVNSQSIENVAEGVLDFKISHRFGMLNSGAYNLFGLDQATIRLGLDYGITDNLMVGFGRSTLQKALDGFVKYRLLRQSSGGRNMPVTLTLHSSIAVNMLTWADPERENYFSSRLTYTYQALIGRKMSNNTSLMLMPTMVHRNLVLTSAESNDVWALGIGGRQKLTNRLAVTGEYYYVFPDQLASVYNNSLSIGIDIETGGHVFQLHFTNSTAMIDKGFITETTGQWSKGDIHFGFNVSRVFTLKDRNKPPKE
jgi:hypothetical protein